MTKVRRLAPPPPTRRAPPPPTARRAPPPPPLTGELIPKPQMINGRLTEAHLHKYQNRIIKHVMENDSAMLWCGLGSGKCQTLSTPILTINGWKTHGTIEAGDILAHPKGGTNRVTQVHPVRSEEVWELELADGRIAECHHEHLWQVNVESYIGSRTTGRRTAIVSKTLTTEELFSRQYKRYSLQRVERLDLPEKDLPIEPYLLGALIGDGSLIRYSPQLSYHVDDSFILDKCVSLLPEGVIKGSDKSTSENGNQCSLIGAENGVNPLIDLLKSIGLWGKYSGERFIPEEYFSGSHEQRLALLQGLMDTDGTIGTRNRKSYSTTSPKLAEDIKRLVYSLGGAASITIASRDVKANNPHPEHTVFVSFVDLNPFSLPRKASMVTPSTRDCVSQKIVSIRKTGRFEDMRCISTERADGLYVINDYIVTHNTVSTLTSIIKRNAQGVGGRVLIVAPLRVIQMTWRQEADKWHHTKDLKFANMTGTVKQRQQALFSNADIYLTNYESLGWLSLQLQTYWLNLDEDFPFDTIVWDEVSKMKRPESNRFKDFSPMIEHFKHRIGLTASPASNGLHNTWGQFYVVDDGERLGKDYKTFQSQFFSKGSGAYGKYIPYDNTRDMIVQHVADITIEVNNEETGVELPEFQVIDFFITLTPKLMKGYLALERDFELALESGEQLEIFNEASLASKLLQYCSGVVYNLPEPELRPDYRVEEFVHKLKDEALDTIIEESGDDPLMIAYGFSSERDRIMKKYPHARCLTGATEEEALAIMDEFNSGSLKLLLVHPLSAGYGLNLQKACNTIVWYGLTYNQESYEQTNGRIMRQGNVSNHVKCIRILAKDTIDLVLSQALEDKTFVQNDLKSAIRNYIANRDK